MSGRLAKLVSGGALAALLPLLLCAGCNNNSAPPNEGVRVPAAKPPVAAVDEHTAATGETPDKPVPPATTAKPGDDSDSSHTADEMPDEDNDSATDEESPADSDSDADTPPAEAFVPESLAVAEKDLLVDAAGLTRLDPDSNVWVDKENKRVVLAGEVCRRDAILEMFACIKGTKEHEAVVSVHCKAFLVHTGLLAVGAEPGHPVRFQPEYEAAEGPEIEITVLWKDEEGEVRQARAQDWIRNRSTGEALDEPFVFGGSGFWTNDKTGDKYYLAEQGDLICVSNFSSALMDLPIESSDHQGAELFEPMTDAIPPEKTPVTLLLTPQPPKEPAAKEPSDEPADDESDAAPESEEGETEETGPSEE